MNELKTLEDRLKSASDRISAAISDCGSAPDETAELREKLARLSAQRQDDLADLDELLNQLRPMMENNDA